MNFYDHKIKKFHSVHYITVPYRRRIFLFILIVQTSRFNDNPKKGPDKSNQARCHRWREDGDLICWSYLSSTDSGNAIYCACTSILIYFTYYGKISRRAALLRGCVELETQAGVYIWTSRRVAARHTAPVRAEFDASLNLRTERA